MAFTNNLIDFSPCTLFRRPYLQPVVHRIGQQIAETQTPSLPQRPHPVLLANPLLRIGGHKGDRLILINQPVPFMAFIK